MSGQHRTTTPRARLAAALLGLVVLIGVGVGGVASAHTTGPGPAQQSTTVARTAPVAGAQESATFRIVDDGRSITILGTARNMRSEVSYESLIYPDGRCSLTETPATLTLAGVWEGHGDSTQYLYARYDGPAYRDVRGHIGSESIRRVDFPAGPSASVNTPLACAPLNPGR